MPVFVQSVSVSGGNSSTVLGCFSNRGTGNICGERFNMFSPAKPHTKQHVDHQLPNNS